MSSITPFQVKRIHVLKSEAGLDEAAYRAALAERGATSCKTLTRDAAASFILALEAVARPARPARDVATGPFAGKLRALWISAYYLGVVRSREDAAMISFVQRQAGVEHTRFLVEAGQARSAVEGLKGWIARAGGVRWPAEGDGHAEKIAVLEAQWRRLVELGAVEPFGDPEQCSGLADYVAKKTRGSRRFASLQDATRDELHEGMKALGRWVRRAAAVRAEAA